MNNNVKWVIIIIILFIQMPIIWLSLLHFINGKKCIKQSQFIEGTTRYSTSSRYIIFEYEVNDRKYKKKYLKKNYCTLTEGEKVLINYFVSSPKYAFPQTHQVHILSQNYNIFAILFLLVADLLIGIGLFATKDIFDFYFNLILGASYLVTVIYFFITELKFTNSNKTTTGKIVTKNKEQNYEIFVAEYTLNGLKYYTREMKVPIKAKSKPLNIGEEVEIKYILKQPNVAIISDDVYSLKNAKNLLITTCIGVVFLMCVSLL